MQKHWKAVGWFIGIVALSFLVALTTRSFAIAIGVIAGAVVYGFVYLIGRARFDDRPSDEDGGTVTRKIPDDHPTTPDTQEAPQSPSSLIQNPMDVLAHDELSTTEKKEFLDSWQEDATRLATAESEGMGGGEPNRLSEVLEAQRSLESTPAPHAK